MSETYSPQAAAEQARDTFRKAAKEFESFKFDTTVPESVRALAEKTVNQSREAYERGRDALEEAIDALGNASAPLTLPDVRIYRCTVD